MCQNSVDEIQCSCRFSVDYLVHEFDSAGACGIQSVEFSLSNSAQCIMEFSAWNQCMEFSAWNSVHGIQCMEFSA